MIYFGNIIVNIFLKIRHVSIKKIVEVKNKRVYPCVLTSGLSFGVLKDYIPFRKKRGDSEAGVNEIEKLIKQADADYNKGNYADAYILLNNYKVFSNGEILWRLCRVLHTLYLNGNLPKEVQGEMINEAYKLITVAHINYESHAEINKWMAIILEAKCELEGLKFIVKNYDSIKHYLLRSHEAKPDDFSILYMLGRWCYSSACLTWFQRCIVRVLYGPLNCCSYEEAQEYFSKAEELKPRFFIPNIFLLGKVNLGLNRKFKGRYYLTIAANLEPKTEADLQYQNMARNILTDLDLFDLCKYALFSEFIDM